MTAFPIPRQAFSRPYLDTSVYVAAIKGPTTEDPGRVALSAQVLAEAEEGRLRVVASTFLHAEVIRDRGESVPLDPAAETVVEKFLQRSFIAWVELDVAGGRSARALARRFNLKPPDAVHLSAAVRGRADVFFTWDARLISATGGNVDEGTAGDVDGISVTTPYVFFPPQQTLDLFSPESNAGVIISGPTEAPAGTSSSPTDAPVTSDGVRGPLKSATPTPEDVVVAGGDPAADASPGDVAADTDPGIATDDGVVIGEVGDGEVIAESDLSGASEASRPTG